MQTNKIRDALTVFDTIHTLDRPRLAEKLAEELAKSPRQISCFVQVNTGREPQKAGIDPHEADAFIAACRAQWKLPITGLMCIPPVDEEPSLHFALLREIARTGCLAVQVIGRMSERGARTLGRFPRFASDVLGCVTLFCVQGEEHGLGPVVV